jgi:hypothetical protein
VILNNSTNINKSNNLLAPHSLNRKREKTQKLTLEIQVLDWDNHKNVEVLNLLMWSQHSPHDKLISNGNTHINKRRKKKHVQIRFHSKRPHNITTMNDNNNMDSTITWSMNARSLLTIRLFVRDITLGTKKNHNNWCLYLIFFLFLSVSWSLNGMKSKFKLLKRDTISVL